MPDSGTFADALSDLFAAQASEEGPSSKQVQAAVTIAQALRDAHVLSAAVDFYNNDTVRFRAFPAAARCIAHPAASIDNLQGAEVLASCHARLSHSCMC